MKLKYKKVILLTAISTMGIGLLTLSISLDRPKAQSNLNNETSKEASLLAEDNNSGDTALNANSVTETPTVLPSLTPTTVPSVTPTPLPVYELKEYAKLDKLFENYYAAKNACDIDKLKSLLSDSSKVESAEELQKKVGYIDDYRNIKCYAKKGLEDGTYIVYVYSEVKLTGVNTPAPGLAKSYVITDKKGDLKIFSGTMDAATEAYYNERNNDADVQELIDNTNKKFTDAKKKDEDLASYVKIIDSMIGNNSNGSDKSSGE